MKNINSCFLFVLFLFSSQFRAVEAHGAEGLNAFRVALEARSGRNC
jgi:hypothetical protein